MNQTIKTLAYVLAVLATLWVWGNCRESAGASKQRLRDSTVVVNAHSHETDARVTRLAFENSILMGTVRRLARNDSVARLENVRLRARLIPIASLPDSVPVLRWQIAVRDSVIDELTIERDVLDSGLTIWKALAVERGDLLQRALQERDGYRAISSAWQRKAEPGALTKLGRALPWIAGGFVLAKVIR